MTPPPPPDGIFRIRVWLQSIGVRDGALVRNEHGMDCFFRVTYSPLPRCDIPPKDILERSEDRLLGDTGDGCNLGCLVF